MMDVEKCNAPESAFYRSDVMTTSQARVADVAKAAHQLASLNAKFLAKFHYGTDFTDRIVDMELDDDLIEFLYPALIEGHEKLVQKQKKQEEERSRKFNQHAVNAIKRVKYDKPWTIVWWKDGKVTRSKCAENDVWSEAAGFNACVAKRYFQTTGAYNKVLKTYCKSEGNGGYSDYERGYKMGYEDGIDIGTMQAVDAAKKEKYKAMSCEYDNGRNLGYEEGYDDGYAAAEIEAYNAGYDAGREYERYLIEQESESEN